MLSINNQINQSLENMIKNNDINKYLDVAAKFPKYSVNNTMLLYSQNPNATLIQSYSDWKAAGRQVQAGEKGITLLKAEFKREEVERLDPITKQPVRNDKGEPIKDIKNIRTGYTKVSVFDISQTKGNELQSLREAIRDDFKTTLRSADIYKQLHDRLSNRSENMQELSTSPDFTNQNEFKQLLQNYAKQQLQRINPNDPMLEQKAEAAKVIVAKHYDLVEQGYQTDLSNWSKDANTIRRSLEDIQRVSGNLIREIDHLNQERIQQMAQERPANLNKAEERLAFLASAHEKSYEIRKEFMSDPNSFKNDPTDDMKILIVYANRMEQNLPIPQNLEDSYHKIRDELDRKFDQPGIEQTGRWGMVDYISRYERAGGLAQAAKDAHNERATDRADEAESRMSKSKPDELER